MAEDDSKFAAAIDWLEQLTLANLEAEYFINNCITEIGQVGANDVEPTQLRNLLVRLKAGQISPMEARAEAAAIFARKHLDH